MALNPAIATGAGAEPPPPPRQGPTLPPGREGLRFCVPFFSAVPLQTHFASRVTEGRVGAGRNVRPRLPWLGLCLISSHSTCLTTLPCSQYLDFVESFVPAASPESQAILFRRFTPWTQFACRLTDGGGGAGRNVRPRMPWLGVCLISSQSTCVTTLPCSPYLHFLESFARAASPESQLRP